MAQAPRWFSVVSVVALLWNIVGLSAFLSDASMGPDDIAKLSEAQQAMYAARPAWALAATGLATIGGVLGSLGLLLRKGWAPMVLAASLLGVLAQDVALLRLPGGLGAMGSVAVGLQALVLVIAVGLVFLARSAMAKGWLTPAT